MNPREQAARTAIERRGLKIVPFGIGWRVYGADVDLLCVKLDSLSNVDLAPCRYEVRNFFSGGTR